MPAHAQRRDSKLAGAGGFEPPYAGIKIRCLTTWLRPTDLPDRSGGASGRFAAIAGRGKLSTTSRRGNNTRDRPANLAPGISSARRGASRRPIAKIALRGTTCIVDRQSIECSRAQTEVDRHA
jgi:hypothetical protein